MDKDSIEEQLKQFKESVKVFCQYHRDLIGQAKKESKGGVKPAELSKKDKMNLKRLQKFKEEVDNMRDVMKEASTDPSKIEKLKKTKEKGFQKQWVERVGKRCSLPRF